MDTAWTIAADATEANALAILGEDRRWNGYSIADLAPPLRQWTRVATARRDDRTAAVLFYQHPAFNSTIPHGDPAGVAAILDGEAGAGRLPERTYVLAREAHLPALLAHYAFPRPGAPMVRMAVDRASFVPPAASAAPAERLGEGDLPALLALYADYAESAFTADQLAHGVFYGVREGDRLVAAGGTHVVADGYGIAAVGNVYTLPTARGRGYGGAVAAAVTAALLAGRCPEVILNVLATNAPAIAIYRRLGYAAHCPYTEASAVLHGAAPRG